ncbi:MAG: hypothetical protein RL562_105 [Planctomycetota bacterium]
MALQLVDIDHRYGRRTSLTGVHMRVEPGDCYGFIGHNGAGKTTTMRIALGLDRPTRGRVFVDGFAIDEHPLEARARMGGMIEVTGFHAWASGRENLVELGRLQGLAGKDARLEAARCLELVGLAERGSSPVRTYSQGMRQRLGLAQALLGRPRYVLLDEPQNGLDPEGIAELREVLRRLTRGEGMTVVLSSHQLHELTGLCNRIGVLRQGRLLLEAETDTLLATARGRYELETVGGEPGPVLASLGVRPVDRGLVEVGDTPPEVLVRALVEAGVDVRRIAPRPTTLEEVYLGLSGEAGRAGPPPMPAPEPGRPDPKLAPRRPTLRMARHELRRNARRVASALLVAVPAFLAWQRIAALAQDHAVRLAEVKSGALFSTSTVTAFEALGRGLVASLPAVAVVAVAVGSQSIAGELGAGTLRNVVLRPLRRHHVVFGKAWALLVAVVVAYGAALAAAWLSARAYFEFGDRFEVTRKGEPELWIEAVDVWPLVPDLIWAPILPLFALSVLGFAIGAAVRRPVWALSTALFGFLVLDLFRGFTRSAGLGAWVPTSYLPSPFGNGSPIDYFVEVSIGSADAWFAHEDTLIVAPLAWVGAGVLLGVMLLSRLRVP